MSPLNGRPQRTMHFGNFVDPKLKDDICHLFLSDIFIMLHLLDDLVHLWAVTSENSKYLTSFKMMRSHKRCLFNRPLITPFHIFGQMWEFANNIALKEYHIFERPLFGSLPSSGCALVGPQTLAMPFMVWMAPIAPFSSTWVRWSGSAPHWPGGTRLPHPPWSLLPRDR